MFVISPPGEAIVNSSSCSLAVYLSILTVASLSNEKKELSRIQSIIKRILLYCVLSLMYVPFWKIVIVFAQEKF